MTTTTTLVKLLHQARTQLQSKWKIWTPASPLSQTKAVVGAPWAQCARAQSTWTVTVVPPSSSVPICRIARTVHQRINQPFSLGGIGQALSKRDCTQPSQVAARSFSTKNYKLKSYSSYRVSSREDIRPSLHESSGTNTSRNANRNDLES